MIEGFINRMSWLIQLYGGSLYKIMREFRCRVCNHAHGCVSRNRLSCCKKKDAVKLKADPHSTIHSTGRTP